MPPITRRTLIDRVLGRKAATEAPLSVVTPYAAHSWREWDDETYIREGYAANPYVYRAVAYIGSSLASLPWMLYQNDMELDEHQLLSVLRRPNPLTGGSALLQNTVTSLLTTGRGHWLKVGPGRAARGGERQGPRTTKAPARELYLMPSARMTMQRGERQDVVGWSYKAGKGEPVPYAAQDVVYFRMPHPTDPLDGMPPLSAAARSVDLSNEARKWNMSLLANGARPSGVFKVEGRMDDESYQRAKEDIRRELGGSSQAGVPLLLEGGASWEQIGFSPDTMSWGDLILRTAREVGLVYHMPAQLMGDETSTTYSNYRVAVAAAWRDAVLPLADMLRDEMNVQLVPDYGEGLRLDYDSDNIEALAEDTSTLWDRLTKAVNAGIVTRNEARAALGYEPVRGGDELTMPGTQVPIAGTDEEPLLV